MAKKPKAPASNRDAEVVEGQVVDYRRRPASEEPAAEGDDAVEVEPNEPDAAELHEEEVPADVDIPAADDEDEGTGEPDARQALVPKLEPRSRSLARLDPMQLYIQDIRRYPLLSREDEHAL